MTRVLLAAVAATALAAPAAQACDFHGGGFGGGFGRYEDSSTDPNWAVVRERLAQIEREQAMETARASLLSRFNITPDAVDGTQTAAIDTSATAAPVQQANFSNADQRWRADASNR